MYCPNGHLHCYSFFVYNDIVQSGDKVSSAGSDVIEGYYYYFLKQVCDQTTWNPNIR